MWGIILIIIGLISFFTGYFFLGKAHGQNDCKDKPESTDINYKGGIAGVVIGVFFILIGIVVRMMMMTSNSVQYSDGSN
jgi:hypothetical protein